HLPTWLAPTQVQILNVTDRVNGFCEELLGDLRSQGVRVEFDRRNEKLNFKIREAQIGKVPFMIIVGVKEAEKRSVSVRLRTGQQINDLGYEQVIQMIVNNIKERKLQPET
ncbi:MAG: His/Gly/Thr/Pro-type tRNA ligase C-terminal domain-containing protein, partial [Pseudobdellovibrionaceae bacterium]